MSASRPIASVSLDLDNQWTYMKTHGDPAWQTFPSYLDTLVPRVLRFLEERKLTITFFVVGQDAALERNRAALRAIADSGHEIGNHSFRHEPWLHLYSEAEIENELRMAEEHIEKATGQRPVGFRGPGFSLSPAVLNFLARSGYEYDCTTLPTFIGPLARFYYFRTAKLERSEMQKRSLLFGRFADGFQPLKPYRWQAGANDLIEIPVTTFPLVRTPIHTSYLLYLARHSFSAARLYFGAALMACRMAGVQPSLLLHPLDFLGCDDVRELAFFPAMDMESQRKIELMSDVLAMLAAEFEPVTVRQHARSLALERTLPVREPARPMLASGG